MGQQHSKPAVDICLSTQDIAVLTEDISELIDENSQEDAVALALPARFEFRYIWLPTLRGQYPTTAWESSLAASTEQVYQENKAYFCALRLFRKRQLLQQNDFKPHLPDLGVYVVWPQNFSMSFVAAYLGLRTVPLLEVKIKLLSVPQRTAVEGLGSNLPHLRTILKCVRSGEILSCDLAAPECEDAVYYRSRYSDVATRKQYMWSVRFLRVAYHLKRDSNWIAAFSGPFEPAASTTLGALDFESEDIARAYALVYCMARAKRQWSIDDWAAPLFFCLPGTSNFVLEAESRPLADDKP